MVGQGHGLVCLSLRTACKLFNLDGFVKDLYCYRFPVFVLSNLCATSTPAMMVRHDRVLYREKERKMCYANTEVIRTSL